MEVRSYFWLDVIETQIYEKKRMLALNGTQSKNLRSRLRNENVRNYLNKTFLEPLEVARETNLDGVFFRLGRLPKGVLHGGGALIFCSHFKNNHSSFKTTSLKHRVAVRFIIIRCSCFPRLFMLLHCSLIELIADWSITDIIDQLLEQVI